MQRFDPVHAIEHKDGAYVRYTDHRAEISQVEAERNAAQQRAAMEERRGNSLLAERDSALARCEALVTHLRAGATERNRLAERLDLAEAKAAAADQRADQRADQLAGELATVRDELLSYKKAHGQQLALNIESAQRIRTLEEDINNSEYARKYLSDQVTDLRGFLGRKAPTPLHAHQSPDLPQVAALEAERDALAAEVAALTAANGLLTERQAGHADTVRIMEAEVARLRKDSYELEDANTTGNLRIERLQTELARLRGELETDRAALAIYREHIQRWIPCSERLPDVNMPVLVRSGSCNTIAMRFHHQSTWLWCEDLNWTICDEDSDHELHSAISQEAVTHWMPLPQPPPLPAPPGQEGEK